MTRIIDGEEYITATEAQQLLGISPPVFYKYLKQGGLSGKKIPGKGNFSYYPKRRIVTLLQQPEKSVAS